jgi:mannan endo-1,6-alpha-mannosidase
MKYALMAGNDAPLPGGAKPLDVVITTWVQAAEQWDDKCGGGIYWARGRQAKEDNRANYKSTISNVQMALLSAQLYKWTKDVKYREFADKSIAWLRSANLLDDQNHLYDGVNVRDCAGSMDKSEWTYNSGTLLGAYAALYDATKEETYQDAGEQLLKTIMVQYISNTRLGDALDDVVSETICEPNHIAKCPRDQPSFKAILVRHLTDFYLLSNRPAVKEQIKRVLDASALAMIERCDDNWSCTW